VDVWFSGLDNEGRGIVGGLEIAKFLTKSNLPKDTLRTIWSLIDNRNLGYVNKMQFNNIIRLVSICCSPIYMGSPPSMERLQKTLYDKIPLPPALCSAQVIEGHPAAAAPTPVPVSTLSSLHPGAPGPAHLPGGATGHMYAVPTVGPPVHVDEDEFSEFSSAAHSVTTPMAMQPPPGASRLDSALDDFGPMAGAAETATQSGPQWTPPASEREAVNKWFAELDYEGNGTVGGLAVAMFLKRSNLPKDTLRSIWALVDSKNAGHISRQQFYNIIRLVSISCSPIYMGAPPSLERLEKTLTATIPLPAALVEGTSTAGLSVKAVDESLAAVQHSPVAMQRVPSGLSTASPSVGAPLSQPGAGQPAISPQWIPGPIDAPYVDKWFAELDRDKKGTVGGMAVVMFLKQSQLPKDTLRSIWSLIDSAQAGHVNKQQFANMMRLVAIQCHPAYAALPSSLERLQQTLHEFIPLPLALVHDTSTAAPAPASASAPAGPAEPAALTVEIPTTPASVQPSTPAQSATAATIQWVPPPVERDIIDRWFAELDTEGKGAVGGLAVAMFLKRSNLPKDILRSIWALVDSTNTGHINRQQFYNIIRLVSIQSVPQYSTYPPSMEGLAHTLHEPIYLPHSLFTHQVPEGAPAPAAPHGAAATGPAAPHAPTAPEPVVDATAPVEEATPVQWQPVPTDLPVVDGWFAELDTEGKGAVGGLAVAMFLKRSNLPKDTLRSIWALVDSKNAGHISRQQFYNIIRLVSIACSPIYMGSAPSLERLEKTLRDDISLPFALTNSSLLETSAGLPPTADATAQPAAAAHDEIGEFAGAPSGSGPPLERVASLGASSVGATDTASSRHRLSVFDDLVENDLKAVEEEWDDFAEGQPQEPVPAVVASNVTGNPIPDLDMMESPDLLQAAVTEHAHEEDPFGSFDQADAGGASVAVTAAATTDAHKDDRSADPFGSLDFVEVSAPAEGIAVHAADEEGTAHNDGDPFGSFDKADVSASAGVVPEIVAIEQPADANADSLAATDDDPFGDFAQGDATSAVSFQAPDGQSAASQSVSEALSVTPLPSSKTHGFDPFAGLESEEPVAAQTLPGLSETVEISSTDSLAGSPPAIAAASATVAEDPFGSLDRGDAVAPAAMPALNVPTVESAKEDPFGSFDELDAPLPPLSNPDNAAADTAAVESAVAPAPAILQSFGDAQQESEDDFDEDFGDFATHSPAPEPNMPPSASTTSLFELHDPVSISQSASAAEMSLFDEPAANGADPFAEFNSQKIAPPAGDLDLLDFLSEPSPSAASVSQSHKGIAQPFEATFATSFEGHTPLGHSPVPPMSDNTFPTISSHAMLNDFFGTPASNTGGPPSGKTADLTPVSSEKLLARKPLKHDVLESYTVALMKKGLYEHAYNCNEQTKLARSVRELNLRKAEAVENDDLETAVVLKKDIAVLQLKLQSVEEEVVWEEEAGSSRRGESLQETADLLSAIDAGLANKFKKKFLGAVPPASAPLDAQLVFQITARRYARMALAISSTHAEYPRQWLLVLQIVVAKVKEGNDIIAQFKKLSTADKNSLISHLKMSEYALGLVAVSEIGMWVSASCTEAMVHEEIAAEVYQVCVDMLAEVDVLWGMGSRVRTSLQVTQRAYTHILGCLGSSVSLQFKAMRMESLTLEAAKLAEHSRVQYCNFTLRPLSYEVNKPDAGMPSVCTCASQPMIMESAVMSRRQSENREDQVV
jgi:Ca2+-binding EF-hand superfamily protein